MRVADYESQNVLAAALVLSISGLNIERPSGGQLVKSCNLHSLGYEPQRRINPLFSVCTRGNG